MPTIDCPDCTKLVSDRATQCIHCGSPLKTAKSFNDRSEGGNYNNPTDSHLNTPQPAFGRITGYSKEADIGSFRDNETGETYKFKSKDVAGFKPPDGLVGKTLSYELTGGDAIRIRVRENEQEQLYAEASRMSPMARPTDNNEKVTKSYLWSLMMVALIAIYWISKGAPNPALFFYFDEAKEQCVSLAEQNSGNSIMFGPEEITASTAKIMRGKIVVQLDQTRGDKIFAIMCIVGDDRVQIPSLLEQGNWR